MTAEHRMMLSGRARSVFGSLLCVVIWLYISAPRIVQSIAGPPRTRQLIDEPSPPMIHSAILLNTLLLLLFGAACFVIILVSLPGARLVKGGTLIAVLSPWVYLVVRNLELGDGVGRFALMYPLVVIAIYFLRPPLSCLKTLAHLTALTAIVSMALAVLRPSSAIYATQAGVEITRDKQILPWGLLQGFLPQPNNLGRLLVLGLLAVSLLRPGLLRCVYVGVIGFALVWTASRSSIYAAIICALIAAVCVAARKSAQAAGKAVTVLSALAMAAVLVALPLVTTDPTAFTNRGYIWRASLDAWATSPWFGLGANWYSVVASTSHSLAGSVFHGHSQFVQALVTGGVVLVALMATLIVALTRAASRWMASGNIFGTVYLAGLLCSCWIEVPMYFLTKTPYLIVVALPMAVLLFAPTVASTGRRHMTNAPAQPSLSQL